MGMGSKNLGNRRRLMPGGVINSEDHWLAQRGWIGAGYSAQMSGKGLLQPRGFRVPRTPLARGGTFEQSSREVTCRS
jgi:hypothetical protein